MRAGWVLALVCVVGCTVNAPIDGTVNYDEGDELPDPVTVTEPPQDEPAKPSADEPEPVSEADAGADAGPPTMLTIACVDELDCAALAPDGVKPTCWGDAVEPTEPGSTSLVRAHRCTFECGKWITIPGWAGQPDRTTYELVHEEACWGIGGACVQLGEREDTSRCVPAELVP